MIVVYIVSPPNFMILAHSIRLYNAKPLSGKQAYIPEST